MGSSAFDSGFPPEALEIPKTTISIGLSGLVGICHPAWIDQAMLHGPKAMLP
jgi:hypothetical protein